MNKSLIKLKLLVVVFITSTSLMAQKHTKVSQAIKVNKGAVIDLNTSHCNIVFDTWNKNEVNIEAYIEGEGLSNEELQEALEDWDIDVDASSNEIEISSREHSRGPHVWSAYTPYQHNLDEEGLAKTIIMELQHELADLPDVISESIKVIKIPELQELPPLPEMPPLPKLPKGVESIHFDYDAYKKDGEKYLEEYSQKFESIYGEDYAKKMEEWGKKFGDEWGEKYGKQMEEWGEKFGKEWNEKYGKQMEEWGKRIEEQMESREKLHEAREKARENREETREKLKEDRKILIEKLVEKEGNSKVKKTIKIKMPKDAKLKVNVRHGEIEFASTVDNLKAELSHTKFIAQSINGGSTSINASYSPVHVTNWNLGELNINYAKKVELNNVKHMVLNANSSDVTIDNLLGNAIIDSNIGDVKILRIDDAFNNLNIILQNCDALITLPNEKCNLQYKGNRSRFSHPKKEKGNITTFTTGNSSNGKNIVVNAKYSNVTMK